MGTSFDGAVASLRAQLPELRAIAQLPEERLFVLRPEISGWTPAEHLDHSLKVAQSIVVRIADAEATPSARGISLVGRAILALGWIPRGRGRAPTKLHGMRATASELESRIVRFEGQLAAMPVPDGAAARLPIVPHPRFGGLTPVQAVCFAAIHTRHHLRIVADVLRDGR